MDTKSYYCGAINHRFNREKKCVEFLAVPYWCLNKKTGEEERQIRFPGGTSKPGNEDKTVGATLLREISEETGLIVADFNKIYEFAADEKTHDVEIRSNIDDFNFAEDGDTIVVFETAHSKYFFLVSKTEGELLKFEGRNPNDPETEAPLWFNAKILANIIFRGHKLAMKKAIADLCMMDAEYANALQDVALALSVA